MRSLPVPKGAATFFGARHKWVAVGVSAFTSVWCGFIWMMVSLGAPMLFPVVFGLLAAVMVWFVLDLWLPEIRVDVGNGVLAFTKRMLGPGRSKSFARSQITDMRPTPGMQANNKLYYRIALETEGGAEHVIATQLDSQRLARRLIDEMHAAVGHPRVPMDERRLVDGAGARSTPRSRRDGGEIRYEGAPRGPESPETVLETFRNGIVVLRLTASCALAPADRHDPVPALLAVHLQEVRPVQ